MGNMVGGARVAAAIQGTPRSGTTWVLECLERRYGLRRIWEPFNPSPYPESIEAQRRYNFGLGLRPYLRPGEVNEELHAFLSRIFSAHGSSVNFSDRALRVGELASSASPRPAIVKFVRSMRLLPWIARGFDMKHLVILRNPVAVVASQMWHSGWRGKAVGRTHPVLDDRVAQDYPALAALAKECKHLEERLALTTCLDIVIALKAAGEPNVEVIAYENFVDDFSGSVGKCDKFFSLQPGSNARSHDEKAPSRTTTTDSNVMTSGDPKRSWEKRLTPQQGERILAVMRACGIMFYSDDGQFLREKLNISAG